ncbi:complex I 24 kDa subunit family protein [Chloroflexota bacterium]
MSLIEKYPQEIKTILAKYPPEQKRSAVMPLLYLAQREGGYTSLEAMKEIGAMLDISVTDVASIVGFYTLFHDKKTGKYHMQVCTDLSCSLRGADQFLETLCEKLQVDVGETTDDGLITIEEVKCLAACDKAPMFQVQGEDGIEYHENMTIDKTMELIDSLRKADKEVKK